MKENPLEKIGENGTICLSRFLGAVYDLSWLVLRNLRRHFIFASSEDLFCEMQHAHS